MNEFKITCSIAKAYEKGSGDDIKKYISGLASGVQTDLDGERMAESAIVAFQKAIKNGIYLSDGQWSLIPLRSGHRSEWDDVLGWVTGAEIDKDHNLWIEAELDIENPVSTVLYKKLTRSPEIGKPVKLGLSVGGSVVDAGYEWDDVANKFCKTYYDVELREVSVVSQPAYPTSYLLALNKSVNWDHLSTNKADTGYQPTAEMKRAAQRALDWREEGNRGGTRVGVTRANQIVNGTSLSLSTVKRMYSFFSRHEVDKKATGFSSGEEGFPSPGRVAWDLWGGDPGFTWSKKIVQSLEKHQIVGMDEDLTKETHPSIMEEEPMEEINTDTLTKTEADIEAAVTEQVEKTETPEVNLDAQVEKSEGDTELADLVKSLQADVAELSKAVASIAEQRATTEKSVSEAAKEVVIEKAKDEVDHVDVVKQAVIAAMEPIMQRLDRIENEPIDKSYAVLKTKYDDEPFEARISREINAVDGRDAVKRALELAFNAKS